MQQDMSAGSVSASGTSIAGRISFVGGAQAGMRFPPGGLAGLSVGTFVAIGTGGSLAIGVVTEISAAETADEEEPPVIGRVDLLGELVDGAFRRGIAHYPSIGNPVLPLGAAELRAVFDETAVGLVDVGSLHQDASIPALVSLDLMLRKHFAIFGSTGAGKSSGVAVILRQIMQKRPDLRLVVLDPHNEYGTCFGDVARAVGPADIRLPFWLFRFDEFVEVVFGRRTDMEAEIALLSELIPIAKAAYSRGRGPAVSTYRHVNPQGAGFTVDFPVPYSMDDLLALVHERSGKLENGDVAVRYQRLGTHLETARNNARYAFMFDETRGDAMAGVLSDLLSLAAGRRSMTVLQLAGFPVEVLDAVVSVVFRLIFEFGVWSDGAVPVLLVCEEAHRYVHADRDIGFRPARDGLARIAKEGRKYRVSLGVVTQRPAELDPTLISQCGSVFAMRLANDEDQRSVSAAVSDPANRLLGFLPSLGVREALAFGEAAPMAMRLQFRELPPGCVPRSQVARGQLDQNPNSDLASAVVARWRGSNVATAPAQSKPLAASFAIQAGAGRR